MKYNVKQFKLAMNVSGIIINADKNNAQISDLIIVHSPNLVHINVRLRMVIVQMADHVKLYEK
jgi:hypothetical protein